MTPPERSDVPGGEPNDMPAERWHAVKRAVEAALELPEEERAAFLDRACVGDAALRQEVDRLVRACEGVEQSAGFLAGAAASFAAPVVEQVAQREARPAPTQSEVLAALNGALAGRYTVEREIGRGGMATVYLASDTKHNRPVALKVVHPALAAGIDPSSGAERFMREVQIAARLMHPHVLPLHDSGEARIDEAGGRLLYYVMPYVEGESLRGRLARSGELPVGEAVRILRQVARALAHAHRHGVVHRDVKPENILLTRDGDALVADFGVAKALSAATNAGALTSAGIALGTPAYMAPEQAVGEPNTDHRADLYAFGVVAYEMLAGRTPFALRAPQAQLAAHLTEAPESVTARRPGVPPELAALVMRCLNKRPADRPQSADELVAALEAADTPRGGVPNALPGAANGPPTDSNTPAEPAAARRVRRRALAATGAAVAVAVAALALVIYLVPSLRPGFANLRSSSLAKATSAPRDGTLPSLAVLPLESLSDLPRDRWFADAIHDQLIAELSTIGSIVVMARTTVLPYRGKARPLPEIARELRVAYLLEATAVQDDGRVRVNARLYDSAGSRVWSEGFEREFTNVLTLQGEVAKRVSRAVEARLTPGEQRRLAGRPTIDTAAFNFYAEALSYHNEGGPEIGVGRDSARRLLTRATGLYERATRVDPDWALAWAQLASARNWLASGQPGTTQADSLFKLAKQAAEHAISLDPSVPEAYAALGFVLQRWAWDWEGSERAYAEALRLSPNSFDWGMASLYRGLGRYEEAIEAYRRARLRHPHSLLLREQLGQMLACAGDYSDALPLLDPVVLAPLGGQSPYRRAEALLLAERYSDAVADMENIASVGSDPPAYMAYAYAKAGRAQQARNVVKAREARGIRNVPDDVAVGDDDSLVRRLESMYATKRSYLIFLRCYPEYKDVVKIPGAKAVLDRLKMPS